MSWLYIFNFEELIKQKIFFKNKSIKNEMNKERCVAYEL